MFHDDFAKIIPKILNKKGILNVGGKIQTIYEFAKKNNPRVKKGLEKNISSKSIYEYFKIEENYLVL